MDHDRPNDMSLVVVRYVDVQELLQQSASTSSPSNVCIAAQLLSVIKYVST